MRGWDTYCPLISFISQKSFAVTYFHKNVTQNIAPILIKIEKRSISKYLFMCTSHSLLKWYGTTFQNKLIFFQEDESTNKISFSDNSLLMRMKVFVFSTTNKRATDTTLLAFVYFVGLLQIRILSVSSSW